MKEGDFGPWVLIRKSDPGTKLSMPVTVGAPGRACSGQVGLNAEVVHNGMGSGTGGPFASWSDTGCDVGKVGVSLAQPLDGIDLVTAIATAYGQTTLSGTWSDGSISALTLATSTPSSIACAETLSNGNTVVTVPVDILASSKDGRVQRLGGRGNIRISINQARIWQQELSLSRDLECATETDMVPYTAASCAITRRVTAQIHFTHYTAGSATDGGSLELYVYDRQSSQAYPGAADRVDRLILAP